MKHWFFTLFFAFSASPLFGAFDYPAFSARNAALSGSYLAATAGWDGFLINPALSANARVFFGELNYFQLFNLKELRYANGVAVLPFRGWGIGVGVENFGGTLYTESKFTVNGAHRFFDNQLSLGVSIHLYHISAKNYGGSSAFGISVGFQYRLLPTVQIAGAIDNLNRPAINGFSEQVPQTIRMGLQYQPVEKINAYASVQKDSWFSPELALGLEYQLFDNMSLQSGYSTRADIPSAGVLFKVLHAEISYALQYHFDLGETHFFSVAFHR